MLLILTQGCLKQENLMQHIRSHLMALLILNCLVLAPVFDLPAAASMLSYKPGSTPDLAEMHTIVYTNKIGSTPVNGGSIEISGQSIAVYGRADEVSERIMLLNGRLVKIKVYSDSTGRHLKGIVYFNNSRLSQDQRRARQNDIVFIEGGFASGKIESFTPSSILIDDHGVQRSIQLSLVRGIRSPYAYTLQIDLSPCSEYGVENTAGNSIESTAANNMLNNGRTQDKSECLYNVVNCSLHETMPPRTIASESIAHKNRCSTDDLDDLLDDIDNE
jgi:hypothetical protein